VPQKCGGLGGGGFGGGGGGLTIWADASDLKDTELDLSGRAAIADNNGNMEAAGGVHLQGSGLRTARLTMSGGSIRDNNFTHNVHYGTGVTIGAGGEFDMSGGIIQGNNQFYSTYPRIGVYCLKGGRFIMSKDAVVHEDNLVRVERGHYFEVRGALTAAPWRAPPVANIFRKSTAYSSYPNDLTGTTVLSGDLGLNNNFRRFLVEGAVDKINNAGLMLAP
jgi:hypothetical protein